MFKLGTQIGYSKCNSQYHLVFKWSRSSRLIKSSRNWWLDDRTISVNVLVMFYSRSATYREHHPVVRSKVKVMRSTYCMSCMSSAVSRVLTGSDMNVRLGECVNLPQQWWVLEVEQSNANVRRSKRMNVVSKFRQSHILFPFIVYNYCNSNY